MSYQHLGNKRMVRMCSHVPQAAVAMCPVTCHSSPTLSHTHTHTQGHQNTVRFQLSLPEALNVVEFEEQTDWQTHYCILQLSPGGSPGCEIELKTVMGRILPKCSLSRGQCTQLYDSCIIYSTDIAPYCEVCSVHNCLTAYYIYIYIVI